MQHHPQSLLTLIARHTTLDIDCNDANVAVTHNSAANALRHGPSLFEDMTSNQLIVLGMAKAEMGSKLMAESVTIAQNLLSSRSGVPALSIGSDGLGGETESGKLEQLVVDVFTIKLGLLMLPNLRESGHLHAQTITSRAYSTAHTILHARRLVALYAELGKVPRERVCIKIPTTIEGLRAMKMLEAEGIRTLATTTFCVEQGLAAAEDARALYIAPYINALEVHFYTAENIPQNQRRFRASSVAKSITIIQRLERLLKKPSRASYSTQVMGASFSAISEIVRLTGMDRMTLSPSMIEQLATTSEADVDENGRMWKDIAEEAVKGFQLESSVDGEDPFSVEGPWLSEGPDSKIEILKKALEEERTKWMLTDALARFTEAEKALKEMAAQAIKIGG